MEKLILDLSQQNHYQECQSDLWFWRNLVDSYRLLCYLEPNNEIDFIVEYAEKSFQPLAVEKRMVGGGSTLKACNMIAQRETLGWNVVHPDHMLPVGERHLHFTGEDVARLQRAGGGVGTLLNPRHAAWAIMWHPVGVRTNCQPRVALYRHYRAEK